MTLRLNLDMDEMTYGNLFDFTDTARAAGKGRDEKVEQVLAVNDDTYVDHLSVEVDDLSGNSGPVILDAEAAGYFSALLDSILSGDGDIRGDFSGLRELREALK